MLRPGLAETTSGAWLGWQGPPAALRGGTTAGLVFCAVVPQLRRTQGRLWAVWMCLAFCLAAITLDLAGRNTP
jgi:hypothetical protein